MTLYIKQPCILTFIVINSKLNANHFTSTMCSNCTNCLQCKISNYRKCSHAIFDMDGLLIDSEPIYEAAINQILNKYGRCNMSEEMNFKRMGMNSKATAKFIVESYQLPVTCEEYYSQLQAGYNDSLPLVQLKPGAEKLIKHLVSSKIPIALATSSSVYSFTLKTQNHQELFSMFHHKVLASSDPETVHGKPAPDIFLVCAKRFEPPIPKPQDCLVFEDAVNGVEAAVAAQMPVVMVPDKNLPSSFTTKATLVLSSLLDFQPEMFGFPPFTS